MLKKKQNIAERNSQEEQQAEREEKIIVEKNSRLNAINDLIVPKQKFSNQKKV